MKLYSYDGPVMEFERCIAYRWRACTYAHSEKEARSNFAFQFKKNNNMVPNTRITLPGKLVLTQ